MSFSSDLTESRPIHEQVIRAVANANGVGPTDLEPLYETIDPEALDELFKPGIEGTISFTYEGHDVTICGDGDATVDGTKVDANSFQTIYIGDRDSEANATGQ